MSTEQSTNASGAVLVVDDNRNARESLAFALRQFGRRVVCCSSGAEALRSVENETFDCIITDLQMPGMSGVELIGRLRERRCDARIVMVTAHASVSTAVEAMRLGAFDYIEKPFDLDRIESLVTQAVDFRRLESPVPQDCEASSSASSAAKTPALIGSSRAMQGVRELIEIYAATDETVLIAGESGVGKEVVARTLHAMSGRTKGLMVSLNCPVLSPQLMESELFGHEKGAFTGADVGRIGRFEQAQGGTILLDEVTEIDLPLQAKLLRVLQERSFERVGSNETIAADARVLATTNRDLQESVREGRFREDLYYRLAVLPLTIPPLRERKEDVPELIEHFLARCAEQLGREPCKLEDDAIALLQSHDWPGNVRELENVVKRAAVMGAGARISAAELVRWLPAQLEQSQEDDAVPSLHVGMSLQEMERRLIEATLEHHNGHRANTAKALGIGVRTLSGKLREYGYAPREKSFAEMTKADPR